MKKTKNIFFLALILLSKQPVTAQVDTSLESKAAGWVALLQLNDNTKAEKVKTAIAVHLTAVKDWHNSHPFTLVPEGINPATGNKLSELDRDIIICSTKPRSIHDDLMTVLRTELDSAQVEMILDKYTIGKVDFTLKGYKAIVPDLTAKEEAEILKNLKQAREQAIDYKNMREISGIFEIYKTKCEQYLNNNGRNWRQLYKAYTDKIKAEKAAAKQQ
ncbi:MAG TPA: DUF3826 domain-containing protein [Ferruginibacter sp.]|mgnify:CR=1 FL=1|nr:DUF3826 domain-containing protein [Ferruginibacter sp.]